MCEFVHLSLLKGVSVEELTKKLEKKNKWLLKPYGEKAPSWKISLCSWSSMWERGHGTGISQRQKGDGSGLQTGKCMR